MSEFMGLIRGMYEAKQEGFLPGGEFLFANFAKAGVLVIQGIWPCYVKQNKANIDGKL